MRPRRSKRIRIEHGSAPPIIPSVSVDAATAARQYGPLGYAAAGAVQPVGEFYDIRAFPDNQPPPYATPAPWFEGMDKPVRQPVVSPAPRHEQQATPESAERTGYQAVGFDFEAWMREFSHMAQAMHPAMYGAPVDAAMPITEQCMVPGPEIEATHAMHEPAAPEAVQEIVQATEDAAMSAPQADPTPVAEDHLVAMAEHQQQESQSLEAMVQDQMALIGPGPAEDAAVMEQQMMDMMLMGGPGM